MPASADRRRVFLLATAMITTMLDVSAAGLPPESWLRRYEVGSEDLRPLTLPQDVSEASGLTTTQDGRLLAHNDEEGVVYELDARNGKVVKRFSLGRFGVEEDFEGIAARGKTLYLASSSGDIFEFQEGGDRQRVQFQMYRTTLTGRNDVEGLCYDPPTDCLLLLCKGDAGKDRKDVKAVYAFDLKVKRLVEKPRLLISLAEITVTEKKKFNPSDIALHPVSGTFFIVSADGACIVEVGRDSRVLGQKRLPPGVNNHPEGITFLPDGTLVICNDGQGGKGSITRYPLRQE
jgi:uncharacterized protein YjiK